jgi:hypothetical protein
MQLKLIKKNINLKEEKERIIDFNIIDLCCADDSTFFLHEDGIGVIEGESISFDFADKLFYTEDLPMDNLCSICYNGVDSLFISLNGGINLYLINLQLLSIRSIIDPNSMKRFISSKQAKTYIAADSKNVFLNVKDFNRCLRLNNYNFESFLGCGKPGFSISNELKRCRISMPTGLSILGESLFICDSGNNYIRFVNDNKIFNLTDNCYNLKDLHCIKNRIFFLSNNEIKMISLIGDKHRDFTIYKGVDEIRLFTPLDENNLLILEEKYE